ncbi:helix-turn-helix transcriptional regulator [Paenibacillus humicola]|uniref:helix-turn-helix transcriptional regulator n=1 Tax=Paenibacillus humicola TaxID=3110540 RepID=UPI00237B2A4A|nr:helix-turn-helix transcriptional regulator [Paenibacillus humicola]
MASDISYTTEEIAQMLKISKLTVYDLIKKGELPSYRVGKQMRVDAADLEAYKRRHKNGMPVPPEPAAPAGEQKQPAAPDRSAERRIVITGQDISLDILAKHMEKSAPGTRPLREYVGSLDSLVSMYLGKADIVSTHLLDGDTGEYNIPYIRKLLVGQSFLVANLLSRPAGIYVQEGNPHRIKDWSDLSRPGVRIVNREPGSGARVLLDEQLRLLRIPASGVNGYERTENNHLAVAGKVAAGEADAGVGIEKAARFVGGVEFIPLIQERYDLVMLKRPDNRSWIDAVLRILRSEAFRNELRLMHGYDLSLTGEVLFET